MKKLAILGSMAVFATLFAAGPSQAFAYGGPPVPIPIPGVHHSRSGGSSVPTTPAPAEGQVLGAAAYNFTVDFGYGTRGQDVTELQKALITAGYLHIDVPTGWFGPLTRAAVKQYQAAHSILQTGFVGPLTRGALNMGTTPATPEKTSFIDKAVGKVSGLVASALAWSAST